MQNMFEKLLISIEKTNLEEQISILIFIASLNQDSLQPLEIENLSKICSTVYKNLYGSDFSIFKNLLKAEKIEIDFYNIKICNKSLWQAIWCNSIKNFELLPLRNKITSQKNHTDFLLWCIHFILNNIDILDKNSLYLLRCIQLILNRKDLLSNTFCCFIIKLMNKVSLSPQPGFKQLACNISKIALQFLEPQQQMEICNVGFLPIKGIETSEIVDMFTDTLLKENLENIVKKVLMMFSNNIENKDGGFLYEKVLLCTFEEWVGVVWPLFFQRLHEIEYEGEFFQSLIKYWFPLTINAYRTDFYAFIRKKPIDLRIKAHILLESRRKGFLFENEIMIYNHLETKDLGLSIISTYKKKSHCPGNEEINFLLDYLYSNLKNYLEDEEVNCIGKVFSQIAYIAHSELKRSDKNVCFYEDFVIKIFNYCKKAFNTEFFEVGAQVLHSFLNILKGSHRELKLIYKLEKKDYYENGENLLYIKLKEKILQTFESEIFSQISDCLLRIDCYSLILTNLMSRHYHHFPFMTPVLFKNILRKVESTPNLQNTEKIINCSNLLFCQGDSEDILLFLEEIEVCLLKNLESTDINERHLFKKVLYLEILTSAKKRQLLVKSINEIVEKSLNLMDHILENGFVQGISYRCTKVLETFIARVIFLISQNIQELWSSLNRKFAIETLIKIIEKSNMKKPVSLSAELLRQFGCKLEEDETGKNFKIQLLNETLEAIKKVPSTNYLKIRRNPESRLVIHAMCISQKGSEKPYLHWTMNYLLQLISNPETHDLSITSCLHTIELLICDNRLQLQTLCYIPDIVVECIELFKRPNWIVRNANLQLAKSLIERLYGVSINNFYRPKNIADLFVLYPKIASYFFRILSLEDLDDRAVILLQFFSESYIKETVLDDDISEILECLKILLVHIIKNYENQYGKLAVKSYVSICHAKDIPGTFADISEFIRINFVNLPKNIFANLILLMQELYEKYKTSFEYQVDPTGSQNMDCSWRNLSSFLKQFDTKLFDFLLVKVKTVDDIFAEMQMQHKNNFWIHNNLTFLFLNANSNQICNILDDKQFFKVPQFSQVKMLGILVERFENDEFSNGDFENVVNSLFRVALSINEDICYLLNCYFKCLIIFQENLHLKLEFTASPSRSLYKNLIILLYVSKKPFCNSNLQFFNLIINSIIDNISVNEDMDIDILSAITLSFPVLPKNVRGDIFKIALYYSLLKSTYLESFHLICIIMNRSYSGFLYALDNFYAVHNLKGFLKDDVNVKSFIFDVNKFVNSNFKESQYEDEFYVVENEVLVPKSFIKKIFRCKKCFIKRMENRV